MNPFQKARVALPELQTILWFLWRRRVCQVIPQIATINELQDQAMHPALYEGAIEANNVIRIVVPKVCKGGDLVFVGAARGLRLENEDVSLSAVGL